MILVGLGVLMVYSASAAELAIEERNPMGIFLRQATFALVGLAVYFAARRMRISALRRLTPGLLAVSAALLLLVLLPGIGMKVNGARRWIDLGFIQFQPSELAKVALVLFIADQCARRRKAQFGQVVLVSATLGLLVLAGPDLGTTGILGITAFAMLAVAGAETKHLVRAGAIAGAGVLVLVASVPYMQQRVMGFLDPWGDPTGSGNQPIHALYAIGSGGLFGRGPGEGLQKISYLPEAHTDMIAATIGEEFGLLGFGSLIVCFAALVIGGYRIALTVNSPYLRLLAAGITTMIGAQAAINLAAVLGLAPITGIPLPFVSYGGTSLVVFLGASGILVNIGRRATADARAAERARVSDRAAASGDRGGRDRGARDAGPRRRRRPEAAWR